MNAPILCYNDPGPLSIILAVVLIVGTIGSFIPQYLSIFREKSSEGLSFVTLTLGFASGLLLIVNTLILKWQAVVCCTSLRVEDCFKNNLVSQTIIVSPICNLVLWLFFLYFYDYRTTEAQSRKQKIVEFRISLFCFGGCLLTFIVTGTVAVVLYYGRYAPAVTVNSYANVLGVAAAVLTFVQWCPQILSTVRAQSGGSLSIFMLLIQAPGAYLVVIFQLLAGAPSWTTWLPYAVGGTTQIVLIVLLVIYMIRDRIKGHVPDETMPLYHAPVGDISEVESRNGSFYQSSSNLLLDEDQNHLQSKFRSQMLDDHKSTISTDS